MPIYHIDLTKKAPRSPRVRLGGLVILPRMLDKGRATIAGCPGEYHYNCPLDQQFLNFVGIDAEALKEQLATGCGDGEILAWVNEHSTHKPSAANIALWSAHQEQRGPTDLESRQYFHDIHSKIAPQRADVATWFDLLDLDDYVSYGGQA